MKRLFLLSLRRYPAGQKYAIFNTYPMTHKIYTFFLMLCLLSTGFNAVSQTNTVQFGQNRLQYKQFKWRYFQTTNFNTYFNQGGLALGKYVAQVAEEELPKIEKTMDYGLRRRLNIVVYNNYGDMKQSNIGIGLQWQNTGGITKLVGNKMIVYFDGDHNKLKRQIREGIARVVIENMLFGNDVGEFAGNAVLLNLPKWFTDGYIAYVAESWDVNLDNELKQLLRTGRYQNFNQLVQEHPTLAGHAFWFYIENVYGADVPSYLLYISRIDRSLKRASQQVLHKNFKQATRDFMVFNFRRYQTDNRGRRQSTRGTVVTTQPNIRADHYRIHPSPRNRNYAMVEFKHGIYEVLLYQGFYKPTVLMKSGVRQLKAEVNPDYPQLAWDPNGTRLAMIYEERGKLKLTIYDLVSRTKVHESLPSSIQAVNSFQYLLNPNTLLLSAVKNGQTDLFTYNISTFKTEQLTNDVFDELDPSYVGLVGKSGIIFASNRPSPNATSADTALPHHRYNIFLLSNWDQPAGRQITRLTDLKMGNARLPMQYNDTYFTFVGDQNGIANRYVGFFKSQNEGVDTLYYIGADILHNPEKPELDSMLTAYGAQQPDSVRTVVLTKDSTYVFPLTNYADGITESYQAGQKQIVSETARRGDFSRTYELKVDEHTLSRRNVSTPLTSYRRYEIHQDSIERGLPMYYKQTPDTSKKTNNFFQSEYGYQPPDTNLVIKQNLELENPNNMILKNARLFPYHLKFSSDYLITQLDNSVLINRYQPFTGGGGPIYLQQPFNGLIQVGVSDLFEDIKFTGGFRFPSDFNGSEYYFAYENLRHYVDWKVLYYRKSDREGFSDASGNQLPYEGKLKTNLYQVSASIPIDPVRSVRVTLGYRSDRSIVLASDLNTLPKTNADYVEKFGLARVEYVYDNTINPAINIWNGLRWKAYMEMFPQLNKAQGYRKGFTYNTGFDARYYLPIYKNFIWATRVEGDFSWGTRKLLYYLGGVDNWLFPKYNNNTPVNTDANYAYQTLAENLRGYDQNIKNGNNVLLINTELRLPVFATFINQPIGSDFVRNFQITSFMDLGTAWNEKLSFKNNSYLTYSNPPVYVQIKNSNLGPFVGGYGFGARTTIAGYFLRLDAAWPMSGFFVGKPILYLALGVDF
jgi:hypothetical protein